MVHRLIIAVFAVAVWHAAPAAAALLTHPVRGEVHDPDGKLVATIGGSITYDEDALASGIASPVAGALTVTWAADGTMVTVAPDAAIFSPPLALTPAMSGALAFFDISATDLAADGIRVDVFSVPGTRDFEVYRSGSFDLVAAGVVEVVPLPAAVWMFGAGVAALAGWRRRSGQG